MVVDLAHLVEHTLLAGLGGLNGVHLRGLPPGRQPGTSTFRTADPSSIVHPGDPAGPDSSGGLHRTDSADVRDVASARTPQGTLAGAPI